MKSIRFAPGSLLFLAFFAVASQAQVQVQRTFVSGLGSGATCSRVAPCRQFATAIAQTTVGGEVIVLDSAGYGPVTITQAVSIIAPQGVYAGISVFSGDGIDINAGSSDVVILRGLTINSQGGNNGIVFNSGATLHIEGCVVNGFTFATPTRGQGIGILGPGSIIVKDTIASGNFEGVLVRPSSGTAFVTMDGLHLDGNALGLFVDADTAGVGVSAAIRNSSASGNTRPGADGSGIRVQAISSGSFAFVDIEGCLVTNNLNGFSIDTFSGGSAGLSISNCTISHNSNAGFLVNGGGAIFSRGNNTIIGNGTNIGSLTPLAAQ